MASGRCAILLLLLVLALVCCQVSGQRNGNGRRKNWQERLKLQHKPKKLARSKLATFAGLTDIDRFMGPQRLDPILQVRVPGTPGNARVRQYITSTFQSLNSWDVQEDRFMGSTPFGEKEFVNIIATLRSPSQPVESDLKLVLACHHDSKLFQQFEFVAATDSAVPCAMLLDLAHNLKASLDAKTYTPYTLQLIFFDGEEAFQSWTSADSLYGSRHLAEKWGRDVLNGIGLFVLLDLIGEANPTFSNYFPNNQQSDRMYKHLQNIETRLRQSGLLFANSQNSPYFTSQTHRGRIADDHLPFLERGVDVVHAIPVPFPNAWHKAGDNKASLDPNTISDLSKIFHIFVAEFLHLAPPE